MARDEPYRLVRSAHDYPGVPATERVYARYDGVASVTASTSGGYADTLGPVRPELGPYAAVDGLSETYWQSVTLHRPGGSVGRGALRRTHRRSTGSRSQAGVDGFTGLRSVGCGSPPGGQVRDAVVDPATGLVEVGLDGRPVDRVRVTVTGVAGTDGVVDAARDLVPGRGDRSAARRPRAGQAETPPSCCARARRGAGASTPVWAWAAATSPTHGSARRSRAWCATSP